MRKILWLSLLLCSILQTAITQNAVPDVTNTFAITNANVVVRPGQIQKGSTVIIKDGLIDQVGLNVTIPIDAEIIKADSMFVYSGFIAGLSHAGIAKKEEKRGESPQSRPSAHNPTNAQAGITPDIKSSDLVDPKEKSIKSLREEGFAIAHTIPRGRMLAGQGSLILLSGSSADAMLLNDNVSLAGSFATANRVYPATTIGVISKWRELLNQAKLANQHERKYKSAPSGLKRPVYDKAIKALYPAASKQLPIFFNTPKVLDLHRAISLQKELDFKMVASNLKQGWKSIDKIRANNLPVILSLDLPKEAKKEKKKKDAKPLDDEMKSLKEKSQKSKKEYVAQAGVFGKSNIPFSFSITEVAVGDVSKNLKRMVKEGLSEEQALAALTTHPAKLFGIQSMAGTIERGKLANIIVSDTSYFKEKAKIKYIFVEGKKYEKEEAKKKEKKNGEAVAIEGEWDVEINAEGIETIDGKIMIEKDGDDFTGSIVAENEQTKFDDITLDGDELTVSFMRDIDGTTLPVEGTFTIDGNDLSGALNIGNGMLSADVSGTKQTPELKL